MGVDHPRGPGRGPETADKVPPAGHSRPVAGRPDRRQAAEPQGPLGRSRVGHQEGSRGRQDLRRLPVDRGPVNPKPEGRKTRTIAPRNRAPRTAVAVRTTSLTTPKHLSSQNPSPPTTQPLPSRSPAWKAWPAPAKHNSKTQNNSEPSSNTPRPPMATEKPHRRARTWEATSASPKRSPQPLRHPAAPTTTAANRQPNQRTLCPPQKAKVPTRKTSHSRA